jgi:F420-non-reducing hydrogenase iron-sulfur subunit
VNHLCNLLEQIGLKGERARMVNLSAAMGGRFAEVTTEFVENIKELGPNPLGENSADPNLAEEAPVSEVSKG